MDTRYLHIQPIALTLMHTARHAVAHGEISVGIDIAFEAVLPKIAAFLRLDGDGDRSIGVTAFFIACEHLYPYSANVVHLAVFFMV